MSLFSGLNCDIDVSGRDKDDSLRVGSIKNDDPGRSTERELFIFGLTSVMDVVLSGLGFSASSTRDGRSLRGRDFRNKVMIRKLIGKMIILLATPINIWKNRNLTLEVPPIICSRQQFQILPLFQK